MGKYVYSFTAEHGPEDFPTLGRTFTKEGETVESDELIEHPRLKLVKGPKKEIKKEEGKE